MPPPLTTALDHRLRLLVRLLIGGMVAGTVLYASYAVLGWGPAKPSALYEDWVWHTVLVASLALCVMRTLLVTEGRLQWALISVALGCWTTGELYWMAFLRGDENAPYPSVADGLWLAFYPAAYAAVLLFVRAEVKQFHRSVVLDGLIGALAVAGLAATFVIEPVLHDLGGTTAEVVTNVSYPIGDLLLLLAALGVFALTGWRPGRKWLFIGGGFALLAMGDGMYLYQVAAGTYAEGAVPDALWLVGLAFLGMAAWQRPAAARELRLEGWPVVVAPFMFTLASIGLLVYGNFSHQAGPALYFAMAALMVAFVRVALTFREVRSLPEAKRQAVTDELTGLANRRSFYDDLRRAIEEPRGDPGGFAVLMIDLDRFKELNDTLGHYVGDLLLKQLGPAPPGCAALERGELARLGGDEFAILLSGCARSRSTSPSAWSRRSSSRSRSRT